MINMPNDIEIEKVLLGCLILDNDQVDEVVPNIEVSSFYSEKNKKIYKEILKMIANDEAVDIPGLTSNLKDKNINIKATYITEICDLVSSPELARSYAKKINKYHKHRKIIKLGNKLTKEASDQDRDITELVELAEEDIYQLGTDNQTEETIYHLEDTSTITTFVDEIEERGKQDGIAGLGTSIQKLDEMIGGLERGGGYTIIAARPSQGKTMLALNIANHIAENHGHVLFFSSEMKRFKILTRLVANRCGINGLRIRNGQIGEKKWKKISNEMGKLNELPFSIIDNKVKNINEIKSIARKITREKDTKVIFVDYLQLLQGFENAGNNNDRVEKLSKTLNNIADQNNCHLIALAQLNRAVEQRNDKRPVLSDLRDSGSIEQDADNVIMLYRDEYYNPDSEKSGIMELLVRKSRDGKVGIAEAGYKLEYQSIRDLSRRSKR